MSPTSASSTVRRSRLGQPGEIAAVVFLPGQRRGRLVTAQNIRINGGPPDRGGGRRDSGGRNPEPDRAGAGPAAAHPDPLVRSCQPMVIRPAAASGHRAAGLTRQAMSALGRLRAAEAMTAVMNGACEAGTGLSALRPSSLGCG